MPGVLLLARFAELLLGLLKLLLAGGVLLVAKCLGFDLKLHHPPADLIQFGGHGVVLDAKPRRGLVDQVDRLVRQKAIGDVAVAEHRRRHDRRIGDAHAVVSLVAVLESAKNRDGVFDTGLADDDRLESPFQGRVLLNVLFVFVERGGADGAKLAARQGGLKQVAGVHRSLGFSRANHRVQFIDEQDDLPVALGDFLDDGFEPVFKFAAIFRAGDQRAHVQGNDALVLEHLGHVAVNHADGQALDDGGFADARLANQHGIVLGSPGQDLHGPADFLVAADDRIKLALTGSLDQITSIALQCLIFLLGILIGHALPAANIFQGTENCVVGHAVGRENLLRLTLDLR